MRETPGSIPVGASMFFHISVLVIRGLKMAFFLKLLFFYFRNEILTPKLVKVANFKEVGRSNNNLQDVPFFSNFGVKWGAKSPFSFFSRIFFNPETQSSPQN